MFEKLDLKFKKLKFDKRTDISKTQSNEFSLPLVNAKDGDNGVMYYGRPEDFDFAEMTIDIVNDGAVSTGNVYSQPQKTGVLYNAYLIKPNFSATSQLLHFFTASIYKSIKTKFGYEHKATWERVQNELITLPTTADNQIDFAFMESFIRELEEERVRELAAYLTASGLADTSLTASEQAALNAFDTLEWGEFRIGDLFEKISVHKAKKAEVRDYQDLEFSVPVVYCKFGDNGIMYWGRKGEFTTCENVISVIYNGAIAAGKVYAQKQLTGILAESYFIQLKNQNQNHLLNLFLSTSLEKPLYCYYSRDYLAIWDRIKENKISLPVRNGSPDYGIMQNFISAVQKFVIKDVVAYVDRKITATKAVVGKR